MVLFSADSDTSSKTVWCILLVDYGVIYTDNFVFLRSVKIMSLQWADHTARMDRQEKHKQFWWRNIW
jgi:hypothetical protein